MARMTNQTRLFLTRYFAFLQIQALWVLRRVLVEHAGPAEWRATVGAQLVALVGRLWLETHAMDPVLRLNYNMLAPPLDDEEVGQCCHAVTNFSVKMTKWGN